MGSFRHRRDGTFRCISAISSGQRGFRVAWNGFDWVRFVAKVSTAGAGETSGQNREISGNLGKSRRSRGLALRPHRPFRPFRRRRALRRRRGTLLGCQRANTTPQPSKSHPKMRRKNRSRGSRASSWSSKRDGWRRRETCQPERHEGMGVSCGGNASRRRRPTASRPRRAATMAPAPAAGGQGRSRLSRSVGRWPGCSRCR